MKYASSITRFSCWTVIGSSMPSCFLSLACTSRSRRSSLVRLGLVPLVVGSVAEPGSGFGIIPTHHNRLLAARLNASEGFRPLPYLPVSE